ncbi:hypothetical protein EJ04DRAFT_437644 [Polyplosphaeria fusca]|uniref:Rhodopsin domain-containing protein n=1 Tax=Polyplosphaeria fusca TaxID=682080 RepID=A0A9P4V2D6_9PLEO|nr:hypothetical protein EJ04DRAFT_437644 [Polyplosphaeria fusca]
MESYYYQRAGHALAVSIAFPIVDIIAVALRIVARKKQKLALQADDWLCLPALFLTIGSAAAMITGVALHATGYPVPGPKSAAGGSDQSVATRAVTIASIVQYAMYNMMLLGLGCVKLSFLAFYHRIFCSHSMGAKSIIIYFMAAISFIWSIGFCFANVFSCGTNFWAVWGSAVDFVKYCPGAKGMQKQVILSISDLVVDALILVIPIPWLWHLQLETGRKVAVTLVFLLGSGAVAASAIRTAFVVQTARRGFDPKEDENLVITGMLYWMMVEICLGLVAACLPTIRFLFKGFSPESVVSSIRSALSLHSLRSHHSRIDDTEVQETVLHNIGKSKAGSQPTSNVASQVNV